MSNTTASASIANSSTTGSQVKFAPTPTLPAGYRSLKNGEKMVFGDIAKHPFLEVYMDIPEQNLGLAFSDVVFIPTFRKDCVDTAAPLTKSKTHEQRAEDCMVKLDAVKRTRRLTREHVKAGIVAALVAASENNPLDSVVAAQKAEIEKLRGELSDARHGCKRLAETADRQAKEHEKITSGYTEVITNLKAKLRAQEGNASGNVVLLRRDGFSQSMTVYNPPHPFGGDNLPHFIENVVLDFDKEARIGAGYGYALPKFQRVRWTRTTKKDDFGRVIYQEA